MKKSNLYTTFGKLIKYALFRPMLVANQFDCLIGFSISSFYFFIISSYFYALNFYDNLFRQINL